MKRILCLCFVALLFCSRSIAADEKNTVTSVLKSATVYRFGAELSHSAKSVVKAGNNELIIEGISNNIDVSSLQIGSDANVTIMSVEFSTDFLRTDKKS